MLLRKITLNNIRSYENQTIEFPEGSTLLSGDIGSGKTSILLGIEFALFGLQPGQRGSSILRNSADQGGVVIEFEINGKNIIIERTLKKSKTISQDKCSITIDNQRQEISVTELKNKVLDLIQYPKEFSKKQNILYKFTVYTPQEQMKQIVLQDPETRINTLRHVFGIDKYKKILENTSFVASKIREEKRINQALITNFDQDKNLLQEKQKQLELKKSEVLDVESDFSIKAKAREQIQEQKEEIQKKINEKNKLEQEIEKTNIILQTKKQSISSNDKTIEQLNQQILELKQLSFDEKEIPKLQQEISLINQQKQGLNQIIIETSSKISTLQEKTQDNENIKQRLTQIQECPTCLQNVNEIYKKNVIDKLDSSSEKNSEQIKNLTKQKQETNNKINSINLQISEKEKRLDNLNLLQVKLQGIQEKQVRLQAIQKSNLSLEKDIQLLNSQIQVLKNSISELKKYESLYETKQAELNQALDQEKSIEIKLAELKKEIQFSKTQIQDLEKKIQETEKTKAKLVYLGELENWLTQKFIPMISYIEKNVMIKLKVEFSNLFSEWFSMLVSDNFNVKLDDNFTPIIEHQDYEIDYAYLSGGERTAIALAYRLSLNQVINSLLSKIKTKDLVILDEPTDGFSSQQLDKMRDVLQELNVKQLIIVSHEQKIEGFVENVIRFKKEGGVSVRE